ncbi:MAG TPA: nicotinate-nucleotide adenylyltransferase, partial [Acidimicrobiales bacterium]
LAMVEAALADSPGLEASAIEIDRGGISFTADTLRTLAGEDPDAERFLVLGADAAAGFETWDRFEEVAELAELVLVDRPESSGTGAAPQSGVSAVSDRFAWRRVVTPQLEISSTEIRERVATDSPIEFLVPPGVVTSIQEHGLYRVAGDRGDAEHPHPAPTPGSGGAPRPTAP